MKTGAFAGLSALEGIVLAGAAVLSLDFPLAAVVQALCAAALLAAAGSLAIRWRRRWQSAAIGQAIVGALVLIGIRMVSGQPFTADGDLLHQVMLLALLAGFLLTCRDLRLRNV